MTWIILALALFRPDPVARVRTIIPASPNMPREHREDYIERPTQSLLDYEIWHRGMS